MSCWLGARAEGWMQRICSNMQPTAAVTLQTVRPSSFSGRCGLDLLQCQDLSWGCSGLPVAAAVKQVLP